MGKADIDRITNLEFETKAIKGSLKEISESLHTFRDEMLGKSKDMAWSKKDIIYLVISIVGVSGVFFAGLNYLIDTRVVPIDLNVRNGNTQINSRLDTFQASIKDLRDSQLEQFREVSQANINISKLEDESKKDDERWKSWYDLHVEANMAQTSAVQRLNSSRLQSIEDRLRSWEDKTIDRYQDHANHAVPPP